MSRVKLPKRSKRYGVGKEIGGSIYVHREYATVVGDLFETARSRLPASFLYVVVKHNLANDAITFTLCPDFDLADEPTVGDSILIRRDGTCQRRKQLRDPYIYHHKWLMVHDEYVGFDVNASKARSLAWSLLPGVDRTRIGRRRYWVEYVVPRIKDGNWLNSDEIRKKLKISTCELSHMREAGNLIYRKVGNTYLYLDEDAAISAGEDQLR